MKKYDLNRRNFIKLSGPASAFAITHGTSVLPQTQSEKRPNIVLSVADDPKYKDVKEELITKIKKNFRNGWAIHGITNRIMNNKYD